MKKSEREQLRKVVEMLEQNPMDYEGAMTILCPLAGYTWRPLPSGGTISLRDLMTQEDKLWKAGGSIGSG